MNSKHTRPADTTKWFALALAALLAFTCTLSATRAAEVTLDGTSGSNSIGTGYSTDGNLTVNLGFFAEYLIVGGGGGGGNGSNATRSRGGGGGGAGGLLTNVGGTLLQVVAASHPVEVGAGGAAGLFETAGSNGGDSSVFGITALGGGGGGGFGSGQPAKIGGSGGGGGSGSAAASGTTGQGEAGGTGKAAGAGSGGGGGGAGQAGINAVDNAVGGNGGNGRQNAITGTAVWYAGGGGGRRSSTGGLGGGGAGNDTATPGTDGLGGGGGGGTTTGAAKGGSGVVIVRYAGSQAGTGGDISTVSGATVHRFTSSGSLSGLDLDARLGVTLTGEITGPGGLIHNGPGKLTLSGANTYSGDTTVSNGTLKLGANNVLPPTAVSIGAAILDAVTRTDTVGTLDVTGAATINLGIGAALAFADSSAVDWTGGALNITCTTMSGWSLRFGADSNGLAVAQLALVSVNGSGAGTCALDAGGYLVPPPSTITVPATLPGSLSTTYGTASAAQSVAVSGANLTADITATAQTGFEVSSDGSTFGATATFARQVDNTAGGTLSVRLAATASAAGSYDSVPAAILSSSDAASKNVATPPGGNTVSKATPTVTVTVGTYIYNGSPQGPDSYTTSPTGDTGTPTWSYKGAAATSYAPSPTRPTEVGAYDATVSLAADDNFETASSSATAFTILTTPTISAPASLPGSLSTTYGTASAATNVAVSGSDLIADVTATAQPDFEVSSDGATFGAAATFTQSGGSASGTLSVRLAATALATGSYDSVIAAILSSTGATSTNVATYASGNTVNPRALTFTGSKACDGSASATAAQLAFGNNLDGANLTKSGSVTLDGAGPGLQNINSFAGLSLGGSAADNYTLTGASGSVTVSSFSNGVWTLDGGGNWSTAGSWQDSVIADGQGSTAWFTNNITAARIVTIDGRSRTVGTLNIGDSDNSHSFTLAASGGATLTLDNSGSAAQINQLSTSRGDASSVPLVLSGGLDVSNASANALALSGIISGTGPITATGSAASSLILSGTNTYTGGTILNQGGITLGTGGTLGTGPLKVNNNNSTAAGTAVQLTLPTGANLTVGSLSGAIASPVGGANTARIATQSGRTFTVNQTADGTYAGTITGAGNFTLGSLSTHTLTLAGANTYTGPTTINAGTLRLGADNTLGTTNNVVLAGGALDMGGYSNSPGTLAVTGEGTLVLGAGSISFRDSSGVAWTGKLTVAGALGEQTVRFGASNTALTMAQLDRINLGGHFVYLDSAGYLRSAKSGMMLIVR